MSVALDAHGDTVPKRGVTTINLPEFCESAGSP